MKKNVVKKKNEPKFIVKNRLKSILFTNNLKALDLANILGISKDTAYKYISNKLQPTATRIKVLANHFGISEINKIIYLEEVK